jgi:prevent-host-death family protein
MNYQSPLWPLQEAKAKFSELVRKAQSEGPQTVTVHGSPAVVVSSIPQNKIDFSGKTGADFVAALSAGPSIDFEFPGRYAASYSREFSFDDENE